MTEREEADESMDASIGGLSLRPLAGRSWFTVGPFLIYIRLSLLMGLFTRQSPSATCANMDKYSKANSDYYALANCFLFLEKY